MNVFPIDSAKDIEGIAKLLLKDSKASNVLPTPVSRIVRCAELKIDTGIDLSQAKRGFVTKVLGGIAEIPTKVLGILDFRQKTIYLDLAQQGSRQRFVQLHEVGHGVLPWQQEAYRWDDEHTLDPSVKDLFDREASYFASCVLFQLGRFDDEASSLELGVRSPLALAKMFGSSCQAAIRRYVEFSKKRCAVLVLKQPDKNMDCAIRNYFTSPSFAMTFPDIQWPEKLGPEYPFVQDALQRKKLHEDGAFLLGMHSGSHVHLRYHFFNNGYNVFALLFPPGETNRSRTRVILSNTRN